MFDHEVRVIRAARRWKALCDSMGVSQNDRAAILLELEDAVGAYERRLRLKPMKVKSGPTRGFAR